MLVENAIKHNIVSAKNRLHCHQQGGEFYVVKTTSDKNFRCESTVWDYGYRQPLRIALRIKQVEVVADTTDFSVSFPIIYTGNYESTDIEDEAPAARRLQLLLESHDPTIRIVAILIVRRRLLPVVKGFPTS